MNKDTVKELIGGITASDNKHAYTCFKQLLAMSESSNIVYGFFELFIRLLDAESSYVRTRAGLLIAANAVWDSAGKLDSIIDGYLEHITDTSPIAARQFIKTLPQIIKAAPRLKEQCIKALKNADLSCYKESMRLLIKKDIAASLSIIAEM